MTVPSTPTGSEHAALLAAGGSPYAVKLPLFEGPLDLLLHLIRLNEVEITDIPVARIAEQYLAMIELMRELDLDIAGEYLVMAATLAWIKSRMLLPAEAGAEGEEEGDPRAELVARLLEYQKYKQAAAELGERRLLGRDVFSVRGPAPEAPAEQEREIEVGLFELLEAFGRALKAAPPTGVAHEVEVETVTVRERMLVVMNVLELRDALDFEEIVRRADGSYETRPILVASFLAILELTRIAVLRLFQGIDEWGTPRGSIHLRRGEAEDFEHWRERIADVM